MPKITIDTDRLPDGWRTAEDLYQAATVNDSLANPEAAAFLRTLADAMPVPLPTTPGSQVRCDGIEWTLFSFEDDPCPLWGCHTRARSWQSPEQLAALGPFEIIRDAGEEEED